MLRRFAVNLSLTDEYQKGMTPVVRTITIKLKKRTKEISVQAVQAIYPGLVEFRFRNSF